MFRARDRIEDSPESKRILTGKAVLQDPSTHKASNLSAQHTPTTHPSGKSFVLNPHSLQVYCSIAVLIELYPRPLTLQSVSVGGGAQFFFGQASSRKPLGVALRSLETMSPFPSTFNVATMFSLPLLSVISVLPPRKPGTTSS